MDYIKDIDNESVDLIFTDIPFNISKSNNFKTMKDRKGRTGIDFGEWDKDFDETQLSKLVPKLKKGGSFVLFHSIEQFSKVKEVLANLELKDKIIWEKTNPMPRNRDRRYISNIEMASWYVKSGDKWCFNRQNDSYDGSVYRYPSESGGGFKRYHPCQKNLQLIEEMIRRHSNENDVVFDPFMGGGTMGVASIRMNRRFVGCELNERYYNLAKERIESIKI